MFATKKEFYGIVSSDSVVYTARPKNRVCAEFSDTAFYFGSYVWSHVRKLRDEHNAAAETIKAALNAMADSGEFGVIRRATKA